MFKGTYDTGLYAGKKYIHIDLTNEPDLTLVEAGVAGPLGYCHLTIDALSHLPAKRCWHVPKSSLTSWLTRLIYSMHRDWQPTDQLYDFAGHAPYIFGRNPTLLRLSGSKLLTKPGRLTQTDFASSVGLFEGDGKPRGVLSSAASRLASRLTDQEFDAEHP